MESFLNHHELNLFSQLVWQLGSGQGSHALRQQTLGNVSALLQAGFAASCIWSPANRTYVLNPRFDPPWDLFIV